MGTDARGPCLDDEEARRVTGALSMVAEGLGFIAAHVASGDHGETVTSFLTKAQIDYTDLAELVARLPRCRSGQEPSQGTKPKPPPKAPELYATIDRSAPRPKVPPPMYRLHELELLEAAAKRRREVE